MGPLTEQQRRTLRDVQDELDAWPTWRAAYDVGAVIAAVAACRERDARTGTDVARTGETS